MNEKLAQALNEVKDAHIEEAAKPRHRKRTLFLRMVAAAAMVALVVGIALAPPTITVNAVSLPGDCRTRGNDLTVEQANASLMDFYTEGSTRFVDGKDSSVWSPVNAFIGLAMVAEVTEGDSRQQILDLFGVEDLDTLRSYVSNIWERVYRGENEICTLANSLWLEESLDYEQDAMDNLAYYYYASVYKGEMGSKKMNKAIGAWLEKNTGGLLKKATDNISLSPETVLALYSTIYLRGTWHEEFRKSDNTKDVFHGAAGDQTVTYMNQKEMAMTYYWADNFSAVRKTLKNGTSMWFILPDEGVSTEDLLIDGQYMQMICGQWENSGEYKVNLSVPKFDITGGAQLRQGLVEMGLTDVFDPAKADFSAITSDSPVHLTAVDQTVRVIIDEEGVKAAAYIEIPGAGAAQPPEDIVDFVVDRPFLFAISSNSVPLFVGCMTQL